MTFFKYSQRKNDERQVEFASTKFYFELSYIRERTVGICVQAIEVIRCPRRPKCFGNMALKIRSDFYAESDKNNKNCEKMKGK